MKKCDICGYLNDDNQMFCQQCGNKLSDSPQNSQYHQQQQPNPYQYNPQQKQNPPYNNVQGTYYQPPGNNYNPQQQPPIIVEKKKSGCFTKALAVIGGIVVFIIVILVIGSFSSSNTDNTNTTTSTVEETTQSKEDFINSCQEYTYKEIARNPNDYKGKHAKFTGEVIQVVEDGDSVALRVNITAEEASWEESGYTYSDTIYVEYTRKSENESRILEDDIITLYGTLNGLMDYSSVLGRQVSCPYLLAEYIEIETV